ncbi:MAG: hypothetical protein R3B60_00380 [Candidatus Paceibacterota bacterium]
MTRTSIINNIKIVALAMILAVGISYTYAAWTSPTVAPPGGNVSAPINTSAISQYKDGPFGVGGFFTAYLGLSANNSRIIEVATPIDGTDAVNKDYVDAATAGGSSMFNSCGATTVGGSSVILACVKSNGQVCRTGDLMSTGRASASDHRIVLTQGGWTCTP